VGLETEKLPPQGSGKGRDFRSSDMLFLSSKEVLPPVCFSALMLPWLLRVVSGTLLHAGLWGGGRRVGTVHGAQDQNELLCSLSLNCGQLLLGCLQAP
jgi:hypothetical protein